MSRELAYLLLICGLLVVPGLLQRVRVPPPLTCFAAGLAVILGCCRASTATTTPCTCWPRSASRRCSCTPASRSTCETLRSAVGPLSVYLLTRALSLAAVAWLAAATLALGWQDATLLALALLTSSTGFIIDSLDRYGLEPEERFWVTNNAISGELLALAVMFVVLKATDPVGLALATLALAGTLVALPLALLALGRWIIPYAAGSAFSLLVMVGFAAAFVTDRLGVEYLLGAFLAGLVARLLERRGCRQLASHDNLRAVKLFSSFFLPFYFFARGAQRAAGRTEPAGTGHRRRADGGAGAAARVRHLGQAPPAGHRQHAQQPARGRGAHPHADLHAGAGDHIARARRDFRCVVRRPAAVRRSQHHAAVVRVAHAVRRRAVAAAVIRTVRRAKADPVRSQATVDYRPGRSPSTIVARSSSDLM